MTLHTQFDELIRACFTGIWIQSFEHQDAITEIAGLCQQEGWRLLTWDLEQGLRGRDLQLDASDPLAAVRAIGSIADDAGDSIILVLQNFHRFLNSPEIVQAVIVISKEWDASADVEQALQLLDQIWLLGDNEHGRLAIRELANTLDVWIGLEFERFTPMKRTMLRLTGGLVTFGGYRLPVNHYRYVGTGKNVSKRLLYQAVEIKQSRIDKPTENGRTLRLAEARSRLLRAETTKSLGGLEQDNGGVRYATDDAETSDSQTPGGGEEHESSNNASEGDGEYSFDNINRGNRIRTCDLLTPSQTR